MLKKVKPTTGWLYQPPFPDHWERRPLYSIAQWVNGLAFRNIQFSDSGKPVIKIAEIKNGISGQTKFTAQTFDASVHVKAGDLLFSWSGQPETSIDAFWWHGPDGWLNQHVFKVSVEPDVDELFFYYLLRYLKPNFVGIARNKQTTGLGHVTKRDLENLEVGIPPLPEQRAIAHILGTLDDKIELNRKMNQTLEEMARALFKSWFVGFDPVRAKIDGRWRPGESLPGLTPDLYHLFPDRLVPSQLGEIPEGWEIRGLSHVVSQIRELLNPQSTPETLFAHYSIPAFDQGQDPVLDYGTNIKSSKARLEPGVVLLSKLNPEIERVWLVDVDRDENPVCSTEFLVLRPKPPFQRGYVYCLTRSPVFRNLLSGLVTGTSNSHQRVQPATILSIDTVCPPVQVVAGFEHRVSGLLDRGLHNRRATADLIGARDALLPKLVTGAVRMSQPL